ncbi:hypothetical protein MHYP_G00077390 [Metynnis hypsauchen]
MFMCCVWTQGGGSCGKMDSHTVMLLLMLTGMSSPSALGALQPFMPNVCVEPDRVVQVERQPCVQAFTRMVTVWKQGCARGDWCVGYERRTVYYTGYRQVYKQDYQTLYRCCPGWSQLSGEAGCLYRKSLS